MAEGLEGRDEPNRVPYPTIITMKTISLLAGGDRVAFLGRTRAVSASSFIPHAPKIKGQGERTAYIQQSIARCMYMLHAARATYSRLLRALSLVIIIICHLAMIIV
jgi:hypothetical protein